MPSNKIALVLYKEWLELRKQRGLLFGIFLPPLLFIILPVAISYFAAQDTSGLSQTNMNTEELRKMIPAFAGMTEQELGQAIVGQQFGVLLLLLPAILPSIIASYSIVGEKTERTLEPLLATPVRTWELLLAKMLTALIPGLLATWLAGAVFVTGMSLVAVSPRVLQAIISPGWVLVFILCVPLLALLTVAATVAISSRVNDPRTAQQISAVLILPVMILMFAQITGILVLSPVVAVAAAVILSLLCAGAVWLAARLFQREVILTRWT
jgi:ABC-2 type transport system permease protein